MPVPFILKEVVIGGESATTGSLDPEYRYVPVRRTSMMEEEGLHSTDLAVADPVVEPDTAEPSGTGKTLSAALLGRETYAEQPGPDIWESDLATGESAQAALCHGVTVLAWARVDGVAPSEPLPGFDGVVDGTSDTTSASGGTPSRFYIDAGGVNDGASSMFSGAPIQLAAPDGSMSESAMLPWDYVL